MLSLGIAGVAFAVAAARQWMADDTYISLRYAANLVRGEGLVYNAGERVEGFTNLLWTLLLAGAMAVGLDGERVAVLGGLASFAATLAMFGWAHDRWRRDLGVSAPTIPLGLALLGASSAVTDFATGGLETALFCSLIVGGVLAIERGSALVSGLLLGLATLTRPDGALIVAVAGLWAGTRSVGQGWRFGLVCVAVVLPATLARVGYYGSLLPNTWYAKSGDLSWWSQGFVYARLHLREHAWMLLLPLVIPFAPLSSIAAIAYSAYIVKVGGDFMVGRLLVPATVLGALALDRSAIAVRSRGAVWGLLPLSIALLAALSPPPLAPRIQQAGIVRERDYYDPPSVDRIERDTATIRRFTDGLPVTVAIQGAQARIAFRADWPVVIEAATGLTDSWIARRPLARRGHVGLEKKPSIGYLILDRRVDLVLTPMEKPDLDRFLPLVEADFGEVWARLLRWTFPLADALKARGARLTNYPAMILDDSERLSTLSDDEARALYLRHWLFYFAHTADGVREAPFQARLPGFQPSRAQIPGVDD